MNEGHLIFFKLPIRLKFYCKVSLMRNYDKQGHFKSLFIFSFYQIVMFAQKKQIVAYFPEWGVPQQHYFVRDIRTAGSAGKITTLIFAFIEPRPDSSGNIVPGFMNPYYDYAETYSSENSIDGLPDDSTQPLRGEFNQLKKLKAMYPDLKILISIGGWTGSGYYSDLALTPESRERFVDDCIDKFISGNLPADSGAGGKGVAAGIFDGFDLDWEFPVSGGNDGTHHNINDKENFSKLILLFRQKLDSVNPGYLLTAAVPADKPNIDNYDLKKDQENLNWFNLMTYDFHGGWDKVAAHHTNLFSSPSDTTDNGAERSFDKSVKFLLDSLRIESTKIIPGAAFYGKGWKVSDTLNNGLYQPGSADAKELTEVSGTYRELIKLLDKGYQYHWDNTAMAPWLFNPVKKIFWSFDDSKSVALKARYADAYNLGGLMFWEISGDDSAGTLVNSIYTRNMPDIKIDSTNKNEGVPSIKIETSGDAKSSNGNKNIILTALPHNSGGEIRKVEFFGDDSSLGYVTTPPFNWVWFNVPKGDHIIRAEATDRYGNKAFSEAIKISVKK